MNQVQQNAEVQRIVTTAQQTAASLDAIHKLAEKCWPRCVKSIEETLTEEQKSCFEQCTKHFLESSNQIVQQLLEDPDKIMLN